MKNIFDYSISLILLLPLCILIGILVIIATIDTKQWGLFSQIRVGKNGNLFELYKIRTMKGSYSETITTKKTHKVTFFGNFLRNSKLDELPQVFNILLGQMSLVGPRPDVPGYADKLNDDDRIILSMKPGITGPAQLKYKNEEKILEQQTNPQKYNNEVIWPDKVRINVDYVKKWSFKKDLYYLFKTVF